MPNVVFHATGRPKFKAATQALKHLPEAGMYASALVAYLHSLDMFPGEDQEDPSVYGPTSISNTDDIERIEQTGQTLGEGYQQQAEDVVARIQGLWERTGPGVVYERDVYGHEFRHKLIRTPQGLSWNIYYADATDLGHDLEMFIYSGLAERAGFTSIHSYHSPRESRNVLPHFMAGEKFGNQPLARVREEVEKLVPLVLEYHVKEGKIDTMRRDWEKWSLGSTKAKTLTVPAPEQVVDVEPGIDLV